jgi:hypothetical protein
MFCPKQRRFIYCSFKKKKGSRNGAVLKALWVFFFPWTREAGEEEDFFFPCFSPTSLPLIT